MILDYEMTFIFDFEQWKVSVLGFEIGCFSLIFSIFPILPQNSGTPVTLGGHCSKSTGFHSMRPISIEFFAKKN